MSVEMSKRTRDVVTDRSDLSLLYTFPSFPVFMGTTTEPSHTDVFASMTWMTSEGSGAIQLDSLLPLSVVYQVGHGSGATGALWHEHHAAFAAFVRRSSPQSVLEIGGSHGLLARNYHTLDPIPWTILEPNPMPVDGVPARFLVGYFDDTFPMTDEYDTVVHSHVLEHIYEPQLFFGHLRSFLRVGQRMIFSIPHMEEMLRRGYGNCVNWEHTALLADVHVKYLLAGHGFRLVEQQYFRDDHSIFYCAERSEHTERVELPASLADTFRSLYGTYIALHSGLVARLNQQLLQQEGPIFIFGAHIFSQYLFAFGLNPARLSGILDNDTRKQGRRLYGTNLTVFSPAILRGLESPSVILKAGAYDAEIRDDIMKNINAATKFLA